MSSKISKLHERLGTAGMVIAIVALVAALGGTAVAAQQALNGKQKKEVEKIAKKYAGKPGATGPAGANGPAGPAGTAGGAGTAGAAGKSVVTGTEAKGANCTEGGVSVEVEGSGSKKYACNGKVGKEGDPWTAGGTLPEGATQTGAWAFGRLPEAAVPSGIGAFYAVPISFSIPLEAALPATAVHYINENGKEVTTAGGTEVTSTVCLGTAAAPSAAPGNLCVYVGELATSELFGWNGAIRTVSAPQAAGASVSGAQVRLTVLEEQAYGFGSWAVTGAE